MARPKFWINYSNLNFYIKITHLFFVKEFNNFLSQKTNLGIGDNHTLPTVVSAVAVPIFCERLNFLGRDNRRKIKKNLQYLLVLVLQDLSLSSRTFSLFLLRQCKSLWGEVAMASPSEDTKNQSPGLVSSFYSAPTPICSWFGLFMHLWFFCPLYWKKKLCERSWLL